MRLESIQGDPAASLVLMERYVNDGSPSGFTFVNTTSLQTRPQGSNVSFPLSVIEAARDVTIHQLGNIPIALFGSKVIRPDRSIFIHPDMEEHSALEPFREGESRPSWFEVMPTSSARTVKVKTPHLSGYLKLHYEGHLGRILRRISLKHALAALETDDLLLRLVLARRLPASFAFLREAGARVFELNAQKGAGSWGMIWRSAEPYGVCSCDACYLIPAFSLFSHDSRDPNAKSILQQLGDVHGDGRIRFLLEELLLPTILSYFAMLAEGGLQGEWHAQNVLFAFDASWHCQATVLRDLESVDRDLPLMSRAGHLTNLLSYPYKCFEESDPNYSIRHSFMFDHKFGEYLLAPLVDHACAAWGVDPKMIENSIVDCVMTQLRSLPTDFFPKDGSWYRFANQLIDQSVPQRPYVRLERPRFRRTG